MSVLPTPLSHPNPSQEPTRDGHLYSKLQMADAECPVCMNSFKIESMRSLHCGKYKHSCITFCFHHLQGIPIARHALSRSSTPVFSNAPSADTTLNRSTSDGYLSHHLLATINRRRKQLPLIQLRKTASSDKRPTSRVDLKKWTPIHQPRA